MKIAIIGAGLTGLTAAAVLKEKGVSGVTLFDKGKSPGGRLATRRIGEGRADHGAQFFTVRTEELKKEADQWLEKGWIQKWFGDPYPRFAGAEGMNRLAKRLAEELDVRTNTRIVRIQEYDQGFELFAETGESFQAEALLLTIPAPQAIDLLNESRIPAGHELAGIRFNPCFVAMASLKKELSLGNQGHLDSSLPQGLERIADQSEKGISIEPIASIYMTGEWSAEHFEKQDDEVVSLILDKVKDYVSFENVKSVQLKRWRYAEAVQPYHRPFMDLGTNHPFLAAGDAFLREDDPAGRTRFESAFLSGIDAGEELYRRGKMT
ncbi:FAD-dependent oxidoreductase [Metabacillus sp. KIGAM252]|uniref:FAD-dependent oxidoreductase n=1 Tax=Metabacillus flavus TaxID=2823519 RepID=A0ABS5LAS3_9BACI|nr:FAD-dependent oxidoreductase [Metabacillus flavus]